MCYHFFCMISMLFVIFFFFILLFKLLFSCVFFFFKKKTAYLMRISDWSSDVCSSDLCEFLAIIGHTGSGKSTIVTLLGRMYDATSGAILIDGRDIREHNLEALRQSFAFVPQDVFLFSDTIGNNIGFGLDNFTSQQVEDAARSAAIYDNIMHFPEQFETRTGERGITLSGGQKQRTSIARAIIKEPSVLIFDDSLSAVDTRTEEEILRHLGRVMQGRTSIIVSHRVSTIRNADKILVMKQGRIAEAGTHDQLIEAGGLYKQLYEKQLLDRKSTRLNSSH